MTSASSECTKCHGADIVAIHKATTDSTKCETCHDDPSNWSKTADCASCHASVPEHGAVHDEIPQDGCSECHSFNGPFLANHDALVCDDCHSGAKAVNPALDYTCGSCHTPSSTPWSLASGLVSR